MGLEFTISNTIDVLGLNINSTPQSNGQYNIKCPFCNDKSHHMNVNMSKNMARCARCGIGVGPLKLYISLMYPGECYTPELGKRASKELNDLLLGRGYSNATIRRERINIASPIECADDNRLDSAYKAVLKICSISNEGINNLLNRGMDISTIRANGYGFISKSTPDIAHNLLSCGIDIKGIPGFYNDNGWKFVKNEGILIPVRNHKRQIVGLQTRTQNKNLRYITLSSSRKKNGTVGHARVHYTVPIDDISSDTVVILTEGPLKADVAQMFFDRKRKCKYAVIAVLGTSAIKFIPEEMKRLKAQGVHTIYNALDLDKLTNVNVARGANKINELIHNEGIQTKNLYWAMDKIKKLFSFLPDNSIAGIEDYVKNCTEDSYLPMIPKEIKGIDDFLKYRYDIS